MKINLELVDQLKALSLSGTHPKVWIASALVYRNKVISYGTNRLKSHPFQKRFGRNQESIYFHAEVNAIYTADKKLKFDKFENSILYIARVKWDSTNKNNFVSGLAMPCVGCRKCISDYGIKTVIYTMDYEEGTKDNLGVLIL